MNEDRKPNGKKLIIFLASGVGGMIVAVIVILSFYYTTVERIRSEGSTNATLASRVSANALAIQDLRDWRKEYLEAVTRPRIVQIEQMDNRLSKLETQLDQSIASTQKDIATINDRLSEIQKDLRELRNRRGP